MRRFELPLLAALLVGVFVGTDGRRRKDRGGRRRSDSPYPGSKIFEDQDILEDILTGYDSRVRPKGLNQTWPNTGGPVVVKINMLLRSISKIDDVNMEYSAQITFREEWVDGRLAYGERGYAMSPGKDLPDFLVLPPNSEIWMPDSFFQNEKQARKHNIDKPNVLIRIYNTGAILYSVRISLVLSCPMDLRNYPMDIQTCVLDVASYAYTSNDIAYIWKAKRPIQLKEQVRNSLPSFELSSANVSYCTSKTNTGEYSCLRTTLTLKRQFSYYLLQLYIPSSMLVIVSWVSFWLDRSAVPARVTLGVTTLLTMTTQSNGINAKLPPVSYTKAIDVWIGVCLALIFGALLEFACVTYVGDKNLGKRKRNQLMNAHNVLRDPMGGGYDRSGMGGCEETSLLLSPNPRYQPQAQAQQANLYRGLRRPPNPRLDDDERNPLLRTGPPHMMAASHAVHFPAAQTPPIAYYPYGMETPVPPTVLDATTPVKSSAALSLLQLAYRPVKKAVKMMRSEKDSSKKIDYCSRLVFPAFFITFNIVYWWYYK